MDPNNRANLMINKLSSKDQNFTDLLNSLTSWDQSSNEEVNSTVKKIIDDVIRKGDQSVLDYTQKFDSVDADSISELVISKERGLKSPLIIWIRSKKLPCLSLQIASSLIIRNRFRSRGAIQKMTERF